MSLHPVGFTAGMETTEGTILVTTADREDMLLPGAGGEVVRVRALSEQGRQQVHGEAQLLASLEVAGVQAAPVVMEIEDDGYVREAGVPVGAGSTGGRRAARGRRVAEESPPGTRERRNLAQAREDLDQLVSALHERGWVLGAEPGEGLAAREDGTVMVRDLRRLRQETASVAQMDDRMWVDSVLHDRDRTLRRRIDTGSAALGVPSVVRHSQEPAADLMRGAGAGAAEPRSAGNDRDAIGGDADGHAADAGDERSFDPLPAPRTPGRREGRDVSGTRLRHAAAGRRDMLAVAATVVLSGLVLGVGGWALLTPGGSEPTPSAAQESGPVEPASPSSVGDSEASEGADDGQGSAGTQDGDGSSGPETVRTNGPEVEDPHRLAVELAAARHQYVTGASDEPVAPEGSAAREQDDTVRQAYEGHTVTGGEPEIHAAELIEHSREDGTAVISVETSTEQHTTVAADGSTRRIPVSERATVHLALHWDGSTWWVQEAVPA